jgi:DNA polymerase-3 subunit alpha
VRYLLPETRPILEQTYGVIVYQEQVMQIAVEVAGFSMAEADVLRKAMGKKKLEVMVEQKEKFISGAERRGVDRGKARELWDYIEPFAGYGFNKSHSVAYAMLAYKTAYLKAHHPVAFMAAMLNSELSTSDAIAKYVKECRAMGIEVLPPDSNLSDWPFTVVEERIRFGLGGVKGIGEGAVEEILGARRRVGRFRGLEHLAGEVEGRQVNHKVFESLIKAGCFDFTGAARRALYEALDDVLEHAQRRRRDREAGQMGMFGGVPLGAGLGGGNGAEGAEDHPAGPEWPESDRLAHEKETLGFYLTGNPLSEHEDDLARLTTHTTSALREAGVEGTVTVGGLLARVRKVKIKSGPNAGRMMGRFTLEDLEGGIPGVVFANQFQQCGHLLEDHAAVVVKGQLRDRGSDLELNVEEMLSLDQAARRPLAAVEVELPRPLSSSELLELREVLIEHAGEVPVRLCLLLGGKRVTIAPDARYKVRFDPALVSSVEGLLGPGAVRERFAAA